MQHSDLQRLLAEQGQQLLRQLYQDSVERQAQAEVADEVVDAHGTQRTRKRTQQRECRQPPSARDLAARARGAATPTVPVLCCPRPPPRGPPSTGIPAHERGRARWSVARHVRTPEQMLALAVAADHQQVIRGRLRVSRWLIPGWLATALLVEGVEVLRRSADQFFDLPFADLGAGERVSVSTVSSKEFFAASRAARRRTSSE